MRWGIVAAALAGFGVFVACSSDDESKSTTTVDAGTDAGGDSGYVSPDVYCYRDRTNSNCQCGANGALAST